jgi:hypothetical protein
MTQKEAVEALETLLREISSYKRPVRQAIETFITEYGIDFEPYPLTRPVVKGIATSSVIREVREGRWARPT